MKTFREMIDLLTESKSDQLAKKQAEKYLPKKELMAKKLLSYLGGGTTEVNLENIGGTDLPEYDYQITVNPDKFNDPETGDQNYIFIIWGPQSDNVDGISISGHFMCDNFYEQEKMRAELDNSWDSGPGRDPVGQAARYGHSITKKINEWRKSIND